MSCSTTASDFAPLPVRGYAAAAVDDDEAGCDDATATVEEAEADTVADEAEEVAALGQAAGVTTCAVDVSAAANCGFGCGAGVSNGSEERLNGRPTSADSAWIPNGSSASPVSAIAEGRKVPWRSSLCSDTQKGIHPAPRPSAARSFSGQFFRRIPQSPFSACFDPAFENAAEKCDDFGETCGVCVGVEWSRQRVEEGRGERERECVCVCLCC